MAFVPSGSVSIVDQNNNVLLTETLDASGNATGQFTAGAAGTYVITAQYSGDANFNPGASQPVTLVITSPKQNVAVAMTVTPNPASPGDAVTVGVSVTPA